MKGIILVETFSFSITGDYYTGILRQLVLSEKWRDAYNMLTESGVGTDDINRILRGTHKFEGVNEFDIIECVDEDYIEELNEVYFGLFSPVPNVVLKPIAKISNVCSKAVFHTTRDCSDGLHFSEAEGKSRLNFNSEVSNVFRYHRYGCGNDTGNGVGVFYYVEGRYDEFIIPVDGTDYVWTPANDYPIFITPKKKASDLDMSLCHLTDYYNGDEEITSIERMRWKLHETNEYVKAVDDDIMIKAKEMLADNDSPSLLYRCEPSNKFESRYGWILPNGDWYNCGEMEHDAMAMEILGDKADFNVRTQVEQKLHWIGSHSSMRGQWWSFNNKMTQKQVDTMFDYCNHFDVDFPQKSIDIYMDVD